LDLFHLPGIDPVRLAAFLANNQFFAFLSLFSGGGLTQLSLIALGVGPYITSSIIMQLMTVLVPSIKSMYHEEGEIGRKKFNQYSRYLSVAIGILQGNLLGNIPFRSGCIGSYINP
jgi:preprotein translocase subunit SecY